MSAIYVEDFFFSHLCSCPFTVFLCLKMKWNKTQEWEEGKEKTNHKFGLIRHINHHSVFSLLFLPSFLWMWQSCSCYLYSFAHLLTSVVILEISNGFLLFEFKILSFNGFCSELLNSKITVFSSLKQSCELITSNLTKKLK